MMRNFQKIGGIAALYEAVAYVVGMLFFIFIVDYAGVVDPIQKVALLVDNLAGMYIITLIIYVIFGGFLVVLTLALHERLQANTPVMMQTATAFGLIWAGVVIAGGMIFNIGTGVVVDLYSTDPTQAATVWLAIDAVFNGLGGGVEILGGLWVLLVSWAALRAGGLPRALNYLGLVVGGAGILTIVPALGEPGGIMFGLGQIVWFVWLGMVMLRRRPGVA
jgi:ABC-type multidrug transport system permease subunit